MEINVNDLINNIFNNPPKETKQIRLELTETLDLTELFEQDYRENKIPLNFHNDGHWNEYAHRLVAKMLATEFYDLLTVK